MILISSLVTQDQHHSFHQMSSGPKVDYDALYKDAAPLGTSEPGQALVNSCLQRYGGEEKLKSLNSLRLVYLMELKMGQGATLTKSLQRDRKHKVRILGEGRDETRILNGDRGWFQNPDTVIAIDTDSGRYRAELFSYYTLALPLVIETESFDGVRYGTRPDDPLGYIYLNRSGSLLMAVGIDPETHLIRSSEGLVRQGDQTFTFVVHFSDHREQEGFTVPGKIKHISMGLELGTSTLTQIEINPEFDDSEFLPRGS